MFIESTVLFVMTELDQLANIAFGKHTIDLVFDV